MCLTIPKQVASTKKGVVCVKTPTGKQELGSLIKVKKGDWILSQNSIVIQKINRKQAKEINNLLRVT